MTVLAVDAREPEQFGEFALWVVAAIIVVAAHLGLAVTYLWLRPEPEMRAEAPAFEVAFMPASNAPAAPPSVDQPEPAPTRLDQVQETPKDPPPPAVQEQPPPLRVREEPPPPMPQVEAMRPHEEPPPPAVPEPAAPVQSELSPPPPAPQEATIVPAEKPPDFAVTEKPAVVPSPSPPRMIHEEKRETREEKLEKHPPKSVASPGTKPMRVASAPNPGVESEGARVGRESWLSALAAHIRRFATYSAGSSRESGTAQVSVTIARNGRLVARRIAGSSGSSALDQAAMAVIERAQPFPPFPASMTEAQVTKIVPLHLRPQ